MANVDAYRVFIVIALKSGERSSSDCSFLGLVVPLIRRNGR